MIYFDRKTLGILWLINRSGDKGITWGKIQKRFGDSASFQLLEDLTVELYTATQNERGTWTCFDANFGPHRSWEFRSYSLPKGRELLERRLFDFWKWVIPTLISVTALAISSIGLLSRQ